jgi:hypothetical protein
VDNGLMAVEALDADPRSFEVRVAGATALLVSKAHKVGERLADPRRNTHIAKDSLDILRLLRGTEDGALAAVLDDARAGRLSSGHSALDSALPATVERALFILRDEFASGTARGCALAGRAASGRDDPVVVAASLAALVSRLLAHMSELTTPS